MLTRFRNVFQEAILLLHHGSLTQAEMAEYLEMMLNSFYFETDKGVTLLGGIPFEWLQKNKKTSLQKLYTSKGQCKY